MLIVQMRNMPFFNDCLLSFENASFRLVKESDPVSSPHLQETQALNSTPSDGQNVCEYILRSTNQQTSLLSTQSELTTGCQPRNCGVETVCPPFVLVGLPPLSEGLGKIALQLVLRPCTKC